jgi:hypothetical protein
MSNKHRIHYIDMRPAPLKREPSPVAIWLGATLTITALCLLTIVLFSF